MAGQFEGGYTSAVNSQSDRAREEQTAAHLAQLIAIREWAHQNDIADRTANQGAMTGLGSILPQLFGGGAPQGLMAPPFAGPPEGLSALQGPQAQAPAPGQPSVPMQMPQPLGAPQGPGMQPPPIFNLQRPSPAGLQAVLQDVQNPRPDINPMPPGAPAAAQAGAAPQGTPSPSGASAPQAAPPITPWQQSPAAMARASGDEMPDNVADTSIGPPPAMKAPKLPPIGDIVKALEPLPPEQRVRALQMLDPILKQQANVELTEAKIQAGADAAALRARDQTIKDLRAKAYGENVEGQNEERKARIAQGWAKLDLGRDTLASKVASVVTKQATNAAGNGTLTLKDDDELRRFMAERLWAGDRTVLQNLGRGAQGAENILALNREAMKVGRELGKSANDLATVMAEFEGLKAGERAVGTRTAAIEVAATEAKEIIPLAIQASEAAKRQGWKVFNDVQQAVQKGTASPELRAFVAADNALVNIYARAINPTGVPTVHDKEHARQMLNTAFAEGDYAATANQMQLEIDAAMRSPGKVKEAMRTRAAEGAIVKPGGAGAPAAAAGGPAPTNAKGWTLHTDKNGAQAYVSPDGKSYEEVVK